MNETTSIEHNGETQSNEARHLLTETEPRCLRTKTESMAVLHRSAGSYHFTPEGRKLADFTSGVLVANLGHHPRRWWARLNRYMGLDNMSGESGFHEAVTLSPCHYG